MNLKICGSILQDALSLAQLLERFLLKARSHSLNTPLWHVRAIIISFICLQVTVGCANIAFLHLSELLQQRKQRNAIHCTNGSYAMVWSGITTNIPPAT
jgi:hypothetical protein